MSETVASGVAGRIRRAVPADLPAVGELTVAAYLSAGMMEPDDPYVETLLDAGDRAAKAEVYVLEDAGELLATVTLAQVGQPYADVAEAGELEFRMLAVAPSAQGRGLGSRLVAFCAEQALAGGLRGLVLCATDRNVAAIRLYERLGFERQPERDVSPVPGVNLLVLTKAVAAD